jgi:cytoskeleton protein RodZ
MSESAGEGQKLAPRSVGEQLSAERMRQNMELSDVAARTRIPLRHLEAIENGTHEGLPATPYSVGFVRTYATMLGLDGPALSRAFRDELGEERRGHFEPEAYEPVDPSRVPSRLLAMVALGVALLLGMGYLLLRFQEDNVDLARLAADTVEDNRPLPPKPLVAPPPAEPAIPTGPITVTATEEVWFKISERAGRTYFMNVLPAGQSYTLPEDAIDPVLRTGRPQSVRVAIGTTILPPIGEPDRLVRAYSLKRDALVAIATAKPAAAAEGGAADNAATPEDIVGSAAGEAPPERRRRSTTLPPAFRSVAPTTEPTAPASDPAAAPDQRAQP